MNYEVFTSFDLIVKVQDNGIGNLSNLATITLTNEVTTISFIRINQTPIGIHICPNPVTNNILDVRRNDGIHKQFDLSILDLSGKLLLKKY